jgi:glyoxylase-like metal-dependent hydrolase (beta-lactamase superfamily II)
MRVAPLLALAGLLLGSACDRPQPAAGPSATPEAPIPTGDPFVEELPIVPGLYAFRFHRHFTLFAVGSGGVIAFDPISPEAAIPYAKAIARRAPGKPLRAIVYSHAHGDHAGGSKALREAFGGAAVPIYAHERMLDAGAIGEEVPKESVELPTVTFGDDGGHLGDDVGVPIDLVYLGDAHARSQFVALFPKHQTVFAVDFIAGDTVGWNDLPGVDLDATLTMQRRLAALPFSHAAFGHAPPSDHRSVERQIAYYTFLRDETCRARKRGWSADDAVARIDLSGWQTWREFDEYRSANVRGAFRFATQQKDCAP